MNVRNGAGAGQVRLPGVRAWSPDDPFLYRLNLRLGGDEAVIDDYPMKIGVRTIEVHGSELRLNGKPLFLTGFGKHEDFAIHGKGLDLPVLVRDFELLKWIGANSFRTSHYPYSEEALMLADEYGFLVIDETPGVSLVFMDPPEIIEARYRQLEGALTELVHRDKNHPCVILWSLANEPIPKPFHTVNDVPAGAVETGTKFFERLFAHARTLDRTRPVALVSVQGGPADWVGQGDVICTNSYNGWYAVSGQIDVATETLEREIVALRARHGDKPVIFTEFGADAVAGVHAQPPEMWSEDYQADLIEAYCEDPAPSSLRGRHAPLGLRRFQDGAEHHAGGLAKPERRLHPRPPAQARRYAAAVRSGEQSAPRPLRRHRSRYFGLRTETAITGMMKVAISAQDMKR